MQRRSSCEPQKKRRVVKATNETAYQLVKENTDTCHFLTGSPLVMIVRLYFPAWGEAPEERIHAGVYNTSGIVTEAYLVKQPYDKDAWDELKTIG